MGAEEIREKVKNLPREKQEEISWNKVMGKASGTKVKDDPTKIKKAIKRKERKKNKSAEAWKSRLDTQKKEQDGRIKKREENIQKRKQDKLNKKMGIKTKPKKKRPG